MSTATPADNPPRGSSRRRPWTREAATPEPFPLGRRPKLPFEREMRPGTAFALVGVLVLAATAIRLAIPRGLWLDEAISVHQAHLGLPALIQDLAGADRQPPLHALVLWGTVRLIGDGDLAVRLPSLVAGIALVPAVAWLATELFDRRTGVVAAMLTTVAPILVWYSQEARGYALEALFCTLAIVGAARAIRRGRPLDWALHAVAAALAVWSHWFALFVVAATELALLAALVRRRRSRAPLRPFLAGWGLSTLALLSQLGPLAVLAWSQAHAAGASGFSGATVVGQSGVSFYTTVSNVSWALFGFHPGAVTRVLSAVWPLAMLACLIMMGRGLSHRTALLALSAVLPVVGLLGLSVVAPDAFDVRYFIAAVPPVLVLLAHMATSWPRGNLGRTVVAGAMVLVLAGALADQQLDPRNPRRYDYGEALAQVQAHAGSRSVVLYLPAELRFMLDRHAPGLTARPLDGVLPTRAQARTVQVVTSFTDQPRYRRVRDRQIGALRATRRLEAHRRYPGVDVWRFR